MNRDTKNPKDSKPGQAEGRRGFLGAAAGASFLMASGMDASATVPRSPVAGKGPKKIPKKIKVAQIGVGHAHATKLEVYRKSDDYEVVGICEPDPKLKKRAESAPAFRDLPRLERDQLLNRADIDIVLVETEVKDLLENAELCIDAGKHVHLDKPAGSSLEHYRRILDKAGKQKLMVQMGYMYRYNPAIVLLKDILKKGWLGEVFEVHTVMSKVVPESARKGLAKYPGGILFELGCHILDLAIGILGKPDKTVAVNRHSSSFNDQLLDNMLAVLEYPSAIATVKSTAQEVEGFARRHLAVCGTEGTMHIQPLDRPEVRLAFDRKRGKYKAGYQTISFKPYQRYVGDADDMARIIRGEKESDYTYEHDWNVQETLMKACEPSAK